MRDGSSIMRDIQREIRKQLDERGVPLKLVASTSGIPYSTLCSYFPGNEREATPRTPAELPGSAMRALFGAIPDDLLNLLIPEGWAVVRVPGGVDFDAVSEGCRAFLDRKERAHHPDSEAGRDLGPTETAELGCTVLQLRGKVA